MIAPLFVYDTDTVKARLRMSGVPSGVDAQQLIEEAMRTVRVGFFRQVSASQIQILTGQAPVENPTNEADVLRQLAEVTEIKWIRYELMRTIPTLFFDSAPSAQQAWNEEAMLRGTSNAERDAELKRLWSEIVQNLTLLEGEETIPDETVGGAKVFVPDSAPPRPGASLFGMPGNAWIEVW